MNIKSETNSRISPPVSKKNTIHRRTISSLTSIGSPSPYQFKKEASPLNKDTSKLKSQVFNGRVASRPNTVVVGKQSKTPTDSPSKLNSPTLITNPSKSFLIPAKCEACSSIESKVKVTDPILAARESLQSLRFEARSCLDSSKMLIQSVSKSRRASVASTDMRMMLNSCNNSEIQSDTLKDLVDSIQEIKSRLVIAESTNNHQNTEETMIKAAVDMLERKIDQNEMMLDSTSKTVGCNAKCILM